VVCRGAAVGGGLILPNAQKSAATHSHPSAKLRYWIAEHLMHHFMPAFPNSAGTDYAD
jgi:hypothetical protein